MKCLIVDQSLDRGLYLNLYIVILCNILTQIKSNICQIFVKYFLKLEDNDSEPQVRKPGIL